MVAKYRYLNGDTKNPYEFKACPQCGNDSWLQARLTFCSRRCSKMGSNNPAWVGDQVKYAGAHVRVYQARGPASNQVCELCGHPAREWAQVHGTTGLDPYEEYRALCLSCHRRYDSPHRNA